MNEIFKNTCYVCGVISAVSITLCILKASFGFLFVKRVRPVEPMQPMEEIPSLEAIMEEPVGGGELEPPVAAGIECGKCHHEIMTSPVAVQGEGLDEKVIFRCEHCGSDVAIPA